MNDLVDEGGFAMVDVGDDGHVADSAHEGDFEGAKVGDLIRPMPSIRHKLSRMRS